MTYYCESCDRFLGVGEEVFRADIRGRGEWTHERERTLGGGEQGPEYDAPVICGPVVRSEGEMKA